MSTPLSAEVEDQIAVALRRLFRGVELHSGHLLSTCGLTGPQLAVLRVVARSEPVAIGVAARQIHVSHATVSGIVDRLVARGLLIRTRSDDDRRTILLKTTDTGRSLLASAPPILPQPLRTALAGAAEWERLALLAALERLGTMVDTPALE